ncbi:MAG: hypothetical protein AB1445_04860 [Bacillota bacterium]
MKYDVAMVGGLLIDGTRSPARAAWVGVCRRVPGRQRQPGKEDQL